MELSYQTQNPSLACAWCKPSVVMTTMMVLLYLVAVVNAYEETENTCLVLAIPSLVVEGLKRMDSKLKSILPPPPQPDLLPVTSKVTALSEEVQSLGRELMVAVTTSQNSTSDTQLDILSGNSATADVIEAAILEENNKTGNLLTILSEKATAKADLENDTLEVELANAALISDILVESSRVLGNDFSSNQSDLLSTNQEEAEEEKIANTALEEFATLQVEQNEKLAAVLDRIVATTDLLTREVLARAAVEQLRLRLGELRTKKRSLSQDNASLKIALMNGPVSPYRARDCWDHFQAGHKTSGVYTIFPTRCSLDAVGVEVWCSMEGMMEAEEVKAEEVEEVNKRPNLFGGDGWTVVLNRCNRYVASRAKRDLNDPETDLNEYGNLKDLNGIQNLNNVNNMGRHRRDTLSILSREENSTNSAHMNTISSFKSNPFETQRVDNATTDGTNEGIDSAAFNDFRNSGNVHYDGDNKTLGSGSSDNNNYYNYSNTNNSSSSSKSLSDVASLHVETLTPSFPHENFTRRWEDYKAGFGERAGEHFIGLTALSSLTASRRYSLLLVVEGKAGKILYAHWRKVEVSGENDKYRLHVGGYSSHSTLPDVLSAHHNQQFSTYDSDNDASYRGSCAQVHGGGWWYGRCYDILPTGDWSLQLGEGGSPEGGLLVKGGERSSGLALSPVASVRMMIKPRQCAGGGGG